MRQLQLNHTVRPTTTSIPTTTTTSTTDRQRLAGFVRRAVRRGFCLPDLLNIEDRVSDMDDKLFHCILRDKHHVLHQLLPPERTDCGYCLRLEGMT